MSDISLDIDTVKYSSCDGVVELYRVAHKKPSEFALLLLCAS